MNKNIQQFIRFLKENGVYQKYKIAFNLDENNKKESLDLFTFLAMNSMNTFISGAFWWDGTDDKFSYWSSFDYQWRQLLLKKHRYG